MFLHLLSSGTITEDLEKLLKKAEKMKDSYEIIEKGPDVVVSSAMPTHNTASAVSLFTKQAIQVTSSWDGLIYFNIPIFQLTNLS